MVQNAFLDKGILLGYCFLVDPHHEVCKNYIHTGDLDYYTTRNIEDIFRKKREEIIRQHRSGILRNIKEVKTRFEGELSSSDIDEIQQNIDRENNNAWRYLLDFYEGMEGTEVYVATEKLRDILHSIEQKAEGRKEELYSQLQGWMRLSQHEEVQSELEILENKDEEDFWVCIDAHDVAANVEGPTELATNNPSDFAKEEIRTQILETTALDRIKLVFVQRDYIP